MQGRQALTVAGMQGRQALAVASMQGRQALAVARMQGRQTGPVVDAAVKMAASHAVAQAAHNGGSQPLVLSLAATVPAP